MSKPKAEPRVVVHTQSSRDPEKGRCGKRAGGHSRVTTILAIVNCHDCRPELAPDASRSIAAAAMHSIMGGAR